MGCCLCHESHLGFNNSPSALGGTSVNGGGFPASFASPTANAFGGAQPRLASFGNVAPGSNAFGNDYGSIGGPSSQFGSSALDERIDPASRIPYSNAFGNGQPSPYAAPGQSSLTSSPAIPMSAAALQHIHSSGANQPAISLPASMQRAAGPASSLPAQSPWDNPEALHRRSRPVDASNPKLSNTNLGAVELTRQKSGSLSHSPLIPQQQAVMNWPQVQGQSPVTAREHSPWVAASKGIVDEGWGEEPGGPNRLTVSNLMQHTQQHQQQQRQSGTPAQAGSPVAPRESTSERDTEAAKPVAPVAPAEQQAEATLAAKSRRKSAAQTQASTAKPQAPAAEASSPATSIPARIAPWSVDDDKKSKPSGLAMGFREIQEAEAKRAEAVKTGDKTARASATAPTSTAGEDAASFTTSWGLPSSKAGAARATKDANGAASPAAASTASVTPVWSQAAAKAPTTKKTMKEIQEEEEKRKKATKEKESAAATARRAYAETTTKVSSGLRVYMSLMFPTLFRPCRQCRRREAHGLRSVLNHPRRLSSEARSRQSRLLQLHHRPLLLQGLRTVRRLAHRVRRPSRRLRRPRRR